MLGGRGFLDSWLRIDLDPAADVSAPRDGADPRVGSYVNFANVLEDHRLDPLHYGAPLTGVDDSRHPPLGPCY